MRNRFGAEQIELTGSIGDQRTCKTTEAREYLAHPEAGFANQAVEAIEHLELQAVEQRCGRLLSRISACFREAKALGSRNLGSRSHPRDKEPAR